MSAAEKLKAAAPWDQWREYMNADIMDLIEGDDMERFLNALPQIVAVMEAAEEGVNESLADEFIRLWPLLHALAALDEALS